MTSVILLSHGSPDPRSSAGARALAGRVSRASGLQTRSAFLDHNEPNLAHAVTGGDTIVVPLFLSAGFHLTHDVPRAVAQARALSTGHLAIAPATTVAPDFVDLIDTAVPSGPVLIATAPTRDNDAMPRELASELRARRNQAARHTLIPTLEQSLADLESEALARAAIALLVLFDGVLADSARTCAGDRFISAPAAELPAFTDIVLRRIDQAIPLGIAS